MIIKIENIKLSVPNKIALPSDLKQVENVINEYIIVDNDESCMKRFDDLKAKQIYVRSSIAYAAGYEFSYDCSAYPYDVSDNSIMTKIEQQDIYADVHDEITDVDTVPAASLVLKYPQMVIVNTSDCSMLSDVVQYALQRQNRTVKEVLKDIADTVLYEYLPVYIDFK